MGDHQKWHPLHGHHKQRDVRRLAARCRALHCDGVIARGARCQRALERSALKGLAPATEHNATAAQLPHALAAASRAAAAVLDVLDTPLVALDTFRDEPQPGLQRRVKHATNKYNTLHNSLCHMASTCAYQAHIRNKLEGAKVRGTKKRPGDVCFCGDSGSHGCC